MKISLGGVLSKIPKSVSLGKVQPLTLGVVAVAVGAVGVAHYAKADQAAQFLLAVVCIALAGVCKAMFGQAPELPADVDDPRIPRIDFDDPPSSNDGGAS